MSNNDQIAGAAPSRDSVIVAKGLWKSFDSVEAVTDLSFSVDAGQVVGLLGPNGAGKTTTINMLATLVSIDAGSATVGGFDVATQPDQVRQLIGLAGQSAAVDEKLTARENLGLFGRLYKIPRTERKRRAEGCFWTNRPMVSTREAEPNSGMPLDGSPRRGPRSF